MKSSVYEIALPNLALMLIPVAIVAYVYYRWSLGAGQVVYATCRMLVQLLMIGYVLTYIFETDNSILILVVLCMMLGIASWIALRPIKQNRPALYSKALISIGIGSTLILVMVTQVVIGLSPWYEPHYLIPLAGMIFSNSMNSVSLGAERLNSELEKLEPFYRARQTAFGASLIPITNSLLAVGLVALPGMMTGQILSGISPLIAARYQIMVMCMIFGAAGISSALYLALVESHLDPDVTPQYQEE